MQKSVVLGAAAAVAVLWTGVAEAGSATRFVGSARLVTPAVAPVEAEVVGITWRCAADLCVGDARPYAGLDDLLKECREVASKLGPLAEYRSRGRVLAGEKLAVCNRAAAQQG